MSKVVKEEQTEMKTHNHLATTGLRNALGVISYMGCCLCEATGGPEKSSGLLPAAGRLDVLTVQWGPGWATPVPPSGPARKLREQVQGWGSSPRLTPSLHLACPAAPAAASQLGA